MSQLSTFEKGIEKTKAELGRVQTLLTQIQ